MPLTLAKTVWQQDGLGGPVLVDWGRVTGGRPDLAAVSVDNAFLFTPSNSQYLTAATVDVGAEVLSLAVGLPVLDLDHLVLGLEDRLLVYAAREGSLIRIGETAPEPAARFVDIALADLDGDGREEIIAASEGREALYIYQLLGEAEARLGLLAIRLLPGPATKVTTFLRAEGGTPVIAAAYQKNNTMGLMTLLFTESGFIEGPSLEPLPAALTSLTSGELRQNPGQEIAWGGGDGAVRVLQVNEQLETVITSNNLGSTVPALSAGALTGERVETLIAGTPEGYLFGFRAPVEEDSPDWAVLAGRPVQDLAISLEGLVGLGTSDGSVQVWLLSARGGAVHVVRPGENLTSIAKLYQATVEAIVEANRLKNPNQIMSGQELVIP